MLPTPPFPTGDYCIVPITPLTGQEWAVEVLGNPSWTITEPTQGTYNPQKGCVESNEEFPNLQTVMAAGPTRALHTVSYICIAGPGAEQVDIAVYPPTNAGATKYLGWKGEHFAEGPAIDSGGGHYWYRLVVEWSPFNDPGIDPNSVLYAKTYRAKPNQAKPFQLWAARVKFE